ncbi:MAG: hypothetical protein KAG96_07475 [Ichthyobacteriaceae bacterium]|nr:hypothetical protein [Ichthyobacteriaceae bacterium]
MNNSIIYIGGYHSAGFKASYFEEKLNCNIVAFSPDYDNETPKELNDKISEAISIEIKKGNKVSVIGSSTGGLTALLMFPYFNVPMYLINPLLSKEQFFDQNHPVGPLLNRLSEILKNQDYTGNKIKFYVGENDELLNPKYTIDFALKRTIEVVEFKGDHSGDASLDMIVADLECVI